MNRFQNNRNYLLLLCCLFISIFSTAQNITTIAGGSFGDGRPATSIGIYQVNNVQVDSADNFYIDDWFVSGCIRKINSSTGIISTVVGGGSKRMADGVKATDISPWKHSGLYFTMDKKGTKYICYTTRIFRIDPVTDILTTVAGTNAFGYSPDGVVAATSPINGFSAMHVDASDNIFFSEGYRIRKISAATGLLSTVAGTGVNGYTGDGGPASQAQISLVRSITSDGSGNLYLNDYFNNVIRKISASGIITTYAGVGGPNAFSGDGGPATAAQLSSPYVIASDTAGNLYITDAGKIRMVTAATGIINTIAGNGPVGSYGEGVSALQANFTSSTGIAVSTAGNLYFSDPGHFTIRKINLATKIISTVCGNRLKGVSGIGNLAIDVQLYEPENLVVDKTGNIFVADRNNFRIYRIDASTRILSYFAGTGAYNLNAGNGGPASAAGVAPEGMAMDRQGNIYFLDAGLLVRKITMSTGIVSLVAGSTTNGYAGDGGLATAAQLNNAEGLAVDSLGNIYIADYNNHRVRKVTISTGIITTIAGNGTAGYSGDGGAATAASIKYPTSVAIAKNGDIYFTDKGNRLVRKIDAITGIITRFAGDTATGIIQPRGDGGPATQALIPAPHGLAFNKSGDLFISSQGIGTVRKVSASTGIITTVAGNNHGYYNGDDIPAITAGLDQPGSIVVDEAGNLFIADSWNSRIRKVTFAGNISGKIFYDDNANGIQDAGEPLTDGVLIKSSSPNFTRSILSYQGQFKNELDTGTYVTQPVVPYYNSVPPTKTSVISSFNSKDSVTFALQPIANQKDLSVSIVTQESVRMGAKIEYRFFYKNIGTTPVNNPTIKFVKSHKLILQSTSPISGNIVGDTLAWQLATLNPRDSGSVRVTVQVAFPPVTSLGENLHSYAVIDPVANDVTPVDDTCRIRQVVIGSFDPNDKLETHAGILTSRQLSDGEYLNYAIRFQNTGNDTAFRVVITDSLSPLFDLNSLQLIGSSHPFDFSINRGNKLTWLSQNIVLPDSNKNEPGSKGYVAFRIKLKQPIALGDSIKNNAFIYFDYNTAVVTNTQTTVIKNPVALPPTPSISPIAAAYCAITTEQRIKIFNLPALVNGADAKAMLSTTVLVIGTDSIFKFNPQQMQVGNNSIIVQYTNETGVVSSTYSFNVVAPVTPDVDVSTNKTEITSTTDQATITAQNKTAGGTTPLYTFAKDRSFTTIIQAEGSTTATTITANQLADGDNWIYVRMKSSDTCVTTGTAIDSVKIMKNVNVTGIIDVDNPSVIINTYPNPINKKISITGLLPTKNYMIVVTDNLGNRIVQRSSRGTSSMIIYSDAWSSGPYWISIFDRNKNKLIGSMRIVKQ